MRWRNGDSFSGQFRDGLRHGPGLLRLDTRDLEVARLIRGEVTMMKVTSLEGEWVAESLEGPGTVSLNRSSSITEESSLLQIEFTDGATMYGHFIRGVVHGFTRTFDSNHQLDCVCWSVTPALVISVS